MQLLDPILPAHSESRLRNQCQMFGRPVSPNKRKRRNMASPRTQNPVQFWQLRKRLTVEQAAHRNGIAVKRYRAVVVRGDSRFTEEEIRQVLTRTGIPEERLRAWEQRPRGDTPNPLAR